MNTEAPRILNIPVTKGKAGTVPINVDEVPEQVHIYAVTLGYKQLVNRGMSKIDKDDKPALLAKAAQNVEAIMAGKVRIIGATKAKVPGAIMTLARAEAREDVKSAIKAAGEKITDYKSSVITQAANNLIASDPGYIERATEAFNARKTKTRTKVEASELLASLGISGDKVGSRGNVTAN